MHDYEAPNTQPEAKAFSWLSGSNAGEGLAGKMHLGLQDFVRWNSGYMDYSRPRLSNSTIQ